MSLIFLRALGDRSQTLEAALHLDLAHPFPTGGLGFENLPEETLEGQAQGDASSLQAEYDRLRVRLGQLGWISHGYVQDRGPGAGGPSYQWTRKVRAKTVSVALSKEQDQALKEAIENWRQVRFWGPKPPRRCQAPCASQRGRLAESWIRNHGVLHGLR